jgi:hypothetical protein
MNFRHQQVIHDLALASALYAFDRLEDGMSSEDTFEMLYHVVEAAGLRLLQEVEDRRATAIPLPSIN